MPVYLHVYTRVFYGRARLDTRSTRALGIYNVICHHAQMPGVNLHRE